MSTKRAKRSAPLSWKTDIQRLPASASVRKRPSSKLAEEQKLLRDCFGSDHEDDDVVEGSIIFFA